jgi:hypothetical protein
MWAQDGCRFFETDGSFCLVESGPARSLQRDWEALGFVDGLELAGFQPEL